MEKKISVQQILNELKTSQLLLNCLMPLGYVPGLPILQIRNDQLCLMIPYLRYKVTGVADKTQVYPIRFALTLVLPEKIGRCRLHPVPVAQLEQLISLSMEN